MMKQMISVSRTGHDGVNFVVDVLLVAVVTGIVKTTTTTKMVTMMALQRVLPIDVFADGICKGGGIQDDSADYHGGVDLTKAMVVEEL